MADHGAAPANGDLGTTEGGSPSRASAGPAATDPLPADPAGRVRATLELILSALGAAGSTVRVDEDDEEIRAEVSGPDLGLLIGRRGQTIDAVQLLCFQIAFRGRPERRRVVVDAAGYRERRDAQLAQTAEEAAHRALDQGRPVKLEPMSAAERRTVHQLLQPRPGIETWSEGSEPHRVLVVSPVLVD